MNQRSTSADRHHPAWVAPFPHHLNHLRSIPLRPPSPCRIPLKQMPICFTLIAPNPTRRNLQNEPNLLVARLAFEQPPNRNLQNEPNFPLHKILPKSNS